MSTFIIAVAAFIGGLLFVPAMHVAIVIWNEWDC